MFIRLIDLSILVFMKYKKKDLKTICCIFLNNNNKELIYKLNHNLHVKILKFCRLLINS